jgi:putative oxidoreductase
MTIFMSRFSAAIYSLLRIVTGWLFLWHGTQKLFGFPGGGGGDGPPAWIQYSAGPIELVGGLLVMVGLLTPWVAFVCSGQMAVAYWMVHAPRGLFPIQNGGELAALYCFVFLFISAHGSGRWSVDGLLRQPGPPSGDAATSS